MFRILNYKLLNNDPGNWDVHNKEEKQQRRKELSLEFAKNGIKNGILNDLFPENINYHVMKTRNHENFKVLHANTERMRKSSIIYMQNLLNAENKEKSEKLNQQWSVSYYFVLTTYSINSNLLYSIVLK